MTNHKTLYLTDRSQWRAWLEANYNKATEIWLVYPNKSTGKPRILYNDAVEEALCFGWIDSIQKSLDKDHAIQRFTPRNLKSDYCQANKERLKWLSDKGMRKNMSPFRQKDQPKLNHVITLLGEIGNRYSKSPAQIALRWLIQQENVLPIPGAKNSEQAVHNAGALTFSLSDSEIESLRRITI